MARRGIQNMAVCAVAAMACHAGANAQPAVRQELERIDFALGDQRYHIAMPRGSKLRNGYHSGCMQIWHPRSTRLVKFLELCSPAGPAASDYKTQATLANGARVRYDIDPNVGGGSGGTEGELNGHIELEGRVLSLKCRDQGEWGNAPGWCLAYLHSLGFDEGK